MKLKMVRNRARTFGECDYYWHGKIQLDNARGDEREHDFLLTESQIRDALIRANRRSDLLRPPKKDSMLDKILDWL